MVAIKGYLILFSFMQPGASKYLHAKGKKNPVIISRTIMARTLRVPRWGGDLVGQVEVTQLGLLVGQGVVEGVDTDVLPEAVETVLLGGRTGTGNFEDTSGDLQGHVGRGDLAGSDGLGDLTTLAGSQGSLVADILLEQVGDLLASTVGQSIGSADTGEVAAVLGQDVVLVKGRLLGIVGEGPRAGSGGGVALGTLKGTTGNTVVEVGEDKLEDGAKEVVEGRLKELLDGLTVGDVEANGIVPREGDLVDLQRARLGETHAHVVPVVGEDEARLLGGHNREDVVLGIHVDTLKDDVVGESTTGGEVLETVENQVIAIGSDTAVVVTRVHSSCKSQLH